MLNLQMVYTLVNPTEPSGFIHPDHSPEINSLMRGPCDLSEKQLCESLASEFSFPYFLSQ